MLTKLEQEIYNKKITELDDLKGKCIESYDHLYGVEDSILLKFTDGTWTEINAYKDDYEGTVEIQLTTDKKSPIDYLGSLRDLGMITAEGVKSILASRKQASSAEDKERRKQLYERLKKEFENE